MSTQDNVKLFERWLDTYNNDVHRRIDEWYPDTFTVLCPGIIEITDKAVFHELEQAVLNAAPDRKLRADRVLAIDDHVIMEGALHGANPDGTMWESPLCEIFTFHDGLVVRDHAYIHANTWPGIKKAE